MVRCGIHKVVNFDITKMLKPIQCCKSTIKPQIDPVHSFLLVAPGEVRFAISHIFKPTSIDNSSKTLHLVLRPWNTTHFFLWWENFVKISKTQPRQFELAVQHIKKVPWILSTVGFRIPIKTCYSPLKSSPFPCYHSINMMHWVTFNLKVHLPSPEHCQATTFPLLFHIEPVSKLIFILTFVIPAFFFFVSVKKTTMGSHCCTNSHSAPTDWGVPSPRQFQHKAIIAFGGAIQQPLLFP